MKQKTLKLEGLNCPSCAATIEGEMNAIDGVEARINLMKQTITLDYQEDAKYPDLVRELTDIVQLHEPEVEVKETENADGKEHEEGFFQEHKTKLIQITLSAIFLILALLTPQPFNIILFLLSYIIVAYDVLVSAAKNVSKGQVFTEHFLMSIATIGAIILGEYTEAVAVMLFYQVGELFQDISLSRSRRSIRSLLDLRPNQARIIRDGQSFLLDPKEVQIGDTMQVLAGERLPLDGKLLSPSANIDTSALSGESMPIFLEEGEEILSASINLSHVIEVKVSKVYQDSAVERIISMVEDASANKAKAEHFITKFSRYYTAVVVFAAIALALIPPLIFGFASLTTWVYRALIFLVISCPCALVISVPLGFFAGIGGASKRGILFKGANYMDVLQNVDTFVFDKTGTLTTGKFAVHEIYLQEAKSEEELLVLAALAEKYSNHPIAQAILAANKKKLDATSVSDVKEIAGHGIRLQHLDKELIVGSTKLMEDSGISIKAVETSGTQVHVAYDGELMGTILIRDMVKDLVREDLRDLRGLGIEHIYMLTGDKQNVADEIALEIGITEYYAELLPEDKLDILEDIISRKETVNGLVSKKVAVVGDGINDAPALARADLGIAMGALGSDIAIEVADLVIMNDDISQISTAIQIAKRTRRIVYQNIIFALGLKILVLILGALGMAGMWQAIFADVGVTILAIFNSMRAMNTDHL